MKRHIPNIITCSNLTSGVLAVFAAVSQRHDLALALIILAAVFDFFDGMSARLLHVSSLIGKELDSLADDISFGCAPGIIATVYMYNALPDNLSWLSVTGLLIPALSAVRLAKFNLDERQTTNFIGLPTPANALFWASLIAALGDWMKTCPVCLYVLPVLAVVMSVLLVSEVPMFSLKFHSLKWEENKIRFIFLILTGMIIVACVLLGQWLLAPACVIFLYILMAVCTSRMTKNA